MKAVVRDDRLDISTKYVNYTDSNGNVVMKVVGLEMDLLTVVLQRMNMTFIHVTEQELFESGFGHLPTALFSKKAYIVLGGIVEHSKHHNTFYPTKSYSAVNIRWYVPCSVKYPKWSSILRILSVELWIFLIISIVIAAISITLFARYSCASERQGYKTLTSTLTKVWAVFLGVSVSTMPRASSLRSLFIAWVCFSLAFSTVIQAFITTFLIDSGYKKPIQSIDELFASGIKLYYAPTQRGIIENGGETESSIVKENLANCPSLMVCVEWAMFQNNVSILFDDLHAEINYATVYLIGENSKPFLCSLKDG
jgi:hypothetical protein